MHNTIFSCVLLFLCVHAPAAAYGGVFLLGPKYCTAFFTLAAVNTQCDERVCVCV